MLVGIGRWRLALLRRDPLQGLVELALILVAVELAGRLDEAVMLSFGGGVLQGLAPVS